MPGLRGLRASSKFVGIVLLAGACGGRYRTELVGHGDATVIARGADSAQTGPSDVVAAPGAGGIQLSRGTYELALSFDIPRAQIIHWKVSCPGIAEEGAVGETADEYRARRIAELRRERERERERVSAVTSVIVGAVAPAVEARGRAGNVNVHARAHVNADAVGHAVAANTVEEYVELAPGDVGRGSLAAKVRVVTTQDGVCAVQAVADDPDVRASFRAVRIRDLEAEARERRAAAASAARATRATLSATLVTQGADPSIRKQRLEAEAATAAQARFEADLSARVVADREARRDQAAWEARGVLLQWLAGKCGAEPGHRQRVADEQRARSEAALVADAALAQRRDDMAITARVTLRAWLIARGAKQRPPRPAPLPEQPGLPPFDDAQWAAGFWSWTGGQWTWTAGGWSDPERFTETGGDEVVVDGDPSPIGLDLGFDVGGSSSSSSSSGPRVRDHRSGSDAGPRVRDHRDEQPRVRDHRDQQPIVRDHRAEPVVRDHRPTRPREDNDKPAKDPPRKTKDDDKPVRVRDHR